MANEPNPAPEKRRRRMQVPIQIDDDVSQGAYCNLAMLNHTETEFVLDFVYVQPQEPKAKVRARILLNPRTAKRLVVALQHNIELYEKKFGTILLPKPPGPAMPGPDTDDPTLMH